MEACITSFNIKNLYFQFNKRTDQGEVDNKFLALHVWDTIQILLILEILLTDSLNLENTNMYKCVRKAKYIR